MNLQSKNAVITRSNAQRGVWARGKRRGQALVEIAFVSVILIMLMMGIIQYGIIYTSSIQLTNITREGARYAAIHGSEADVVNMTKNHIRNNIAPGTTIRTAGLPAANIEVIKDSDAVKGEPITVTLTYDMSQKFLFKTPAAGKPMMFGSLKSTDSRWNAYKTSATMIIE